MCVYLMSFFNNRIIYTIVPKLYPLSGICTPCFVTKLSPAVTVSSTLFWAQRYFWLIWHATLEGFRCTFRKVSNDMFLIFFQIEEARETKVLNIWAWKKTFLKSLTLTNVNIYYVHSLLQLYKKTVICSW